MGTSHSFTRQITEGTQVDPFSHPKAYHLVESGEFGGDDVGQRARNAVDRACSQIKVCRPDADILKTHIQNEYFTKWDESFVVDEFRGFPKEKFSELVDKINAKFEVTGENVGPKLECAQRAREWSYKVYRIERVIDSGTHFFGMIALGKEEHAGEDAFYALTFLYKLDIAFARVKHETRTRSYMFGIPYTEQYEERWEDKGIETATQKSWTNFCRINALDTVSRQGLLAYGILNVLSIEETD